jgi:ribosomal protein S18 acetylase RimI-like enzyme
VTYTYKNAEESDREAIYQLYRLVMHGFISEIWGWDEQWQRGDFSTHFDSQGITLALKEHKLVGYSHIENQDSQIFIRMIVVHPHHQRNGIGTKLLESVITSADKKRKKVSLEVFKINGVAKAFYERHGFNVEGETPSSHIMTQETSESDSIEGTTNGLKQSRSAIGK